MDAFLKYYPFDIFPSFWKQLSDHLIQGNVLLISSVKDEINRHNDELKAWIQPFTAVDEFTDESVTERFSAIMEAEEESGFYTPEAINRWYEDRADPWLIAYCSVYGYTLISHEKSVGARNSKNPSNKMRIPDVARDNQVPCNNLLFMMRALHFKM